MKDKPGLKNLTVENKSMGSPSYAGYKLQAGIPGRRDRAFFGVGIEAMEKNGPSN